MKKLTFLREGGGEWESILCLCYVYNLHKLRVWDFKDILPKKRCQTIKNGIFFPVFSEILIIFVKSLKTEFISHFQISKWSWSNLRSYTVWIKTKTSGLFLVNDLQLFLVNDTPPSKRADGIFFLRGRRPPHSPPGMCPWTPHAFGLRTLIGTG